MKVAVSSRGPTPESVVDPRFGRAALFVLYDTDSGAVSAFDNAQNLNAAQGAGIQAAENVSRLGAQAVITGHCGPKAFRTLKAAGIRVYQAGEVTVAQAVEALRQGTLKESTGADVEGHWA